MYKNLKKRIWEILDTARPNDRTSRTFDILLVSLISLNVVALVAETVRPIYRAAPILFVVIEIVSVVIFSAEYLARLWSCTSVTEFAHPVWGRLRFAKTPLAIIDLLAVLPFYLPFTAIDLRVIRSVRLVRVFRIAKLARYSESLKTFGRVFLKKKEELITILLFSMILLLCASTLMYYIESEEQPDKFGSIPETMWWGIATLTTVGYGDVYPVTAVGKMLGAVIAILGIGLFALPTGILGAAFIEDLNARKTRPTLCPHCGKSLTEGGESDAVSAPSL